MNHVNLKTTLELITTGKNINVYEAQKMGIIDKVIIFNLTDINVKYFN